MSDYEYIRKKKEDRPVLAICYDFDKTLTPTDMQAQGYIQALGYEVPAFWTESNVLSESNEMDQNLAYMFKMMDESTGKILFTKQKLEEYGAKVSFFPGVENWFNRIKEYGNQHGVIIEHYIISSGLKEMIEGTSVAKEFEKIFASSFYFNDRGVAVWPAQVINYTNKTQFLFRIEKGVLDINDPGVNDYFAPEEIRVPFRNMVYIGDSDTDVPCMKLVNSYGGHSIGVFNADSKDKTKVFNMMRDQRIKYFTAADYSEESDLDKLVKAIIEKTAKAEVLEQYSYRCKVEAADAAGEDNEDERIRKEAILSLESSHSFADTHFAVKKLQTVDSWSEDEINRLCEIALNNFQIRYILTDKDVSAFYLMLLNLPHQNTAQAQEIKTILSNKG